MNVIDRSIDFVAQWEPAFAATLRGCSPAEIAAIEVQMGRPCSPVYRAFLARCCEDLGSIDLGAYSSSVSLLLRERGATLGALPDGIELLAMSTGDDEDDIFVVHDPATPGDAKIVRHASLEFEDTGDFDLVQAEPVAGGLGELFCLPALNRHHALAQPHAVALTAAQLEPDALERCRAIAAAFGAVPYWFSNDWTYVGHVDGVVVVAKQAPGWYLSVGVAGPERYAWAAVAGTLAFRLGLQPYR